MANAKLSKLERVEELHRAIVDENIQLFTAYMKDPLTHEFIDHVDDEGFTALYLACRSGHKEKVVLMMVTEILKLKANVDSKGDDRETALYIASHNQLAAVVRYLLTSGAKVNEMNGSQGDTALHCAAKFGYVDLCRILLLEGNANLNARNTAMETPLFVACRAGRYETVYDLLLKDANKNLMDQDGRNALFIASERGHKSCVSLLKVEKEYLKDAKSAADVEARMQTVSINDPAEIAKRAEKTKEADEKEAKKSRDQPMPNMIRIEDIEPKGEVEERTHDPLTGKKLPPAFRSMVGATPVVPVPEGLVKPFKEEFVGGTSMNVGTGTGQKFKQRNVLDSLGQDDALLFAAHGVATPADLQKKAKKSGGV